MASSQVEIAAAAAAASSSSSPSPFGCVLRYHNRRAYPWTNTDSNAAAFHKNFKDFVHSMSSGQQKNAASGSDSHNHHINPADLWVHIPTYTINQNHHSRNNANDKWGGATEMVSPADAITQNRGSSAPVTPLRRDNSPATQSETCLEIPNSGGVSSLVQKWRHFEAEAKTSTTNNSTNSPVSTTRSNLGSSFPVEISQRGSDAADHESMDARSANEDSFGDWESNRTALSGPPSPQGKASDATEKERLRVADIIRKLTSSNEENNNDREHSLVTSESLPRVRTSSDQSSEQRPFSPVIGSPRLRGRRAFCDLLMQMEHDRHRELQGLVQRKAVSRFSYRGRIQAMLRVQFLRRGLEVKDGRQFNCTSSPSNRLTRSSILHLREKFKPVSQHVLIYSKNSHKEVADNTSQVENLSSTSNLIEKDNHHEEVTSLTCPHTEVVENIQHTESSCTSNIVAVDSHLETKTTLQKKSLKAPCSENVYQEASLKLDVLQQSANDKIRSFGLLQSSEITPSFNNIEEERHAGEQDAKGQQLIEVSHNRLSYNVDLHGDQLLTETSHNSTSSCPLPPCDWEEEGANNHYLSESEHGWVSDVSHSQVGWEELYSDYERQAETSQDWIIDVSRPRCEWEGLRQARYLEMLDPFLENEEICQLLQRKSVSNFLSSGLREKIDRLMISRTQQQPTPMGSQRDKDEEQVAGEEEERAQEYEEEREEGQEGEEDETEEEGGNAGYDDDSEEDEEDESRIEEQYEFEEYVDQMTSSMPSTSWNHNEGPEASDDSDQVVSPSLQQNTSRNSYSLESRRCFSNTNNSSIEMELIYELRGHMEQLHQEMSELRKSIKSCMNMQLKLQRSVKQEVAAAALGHSDQRRGRHSKQRKDPSTGICCICHEVQVDSLLYRCGHMCTCFKCAHELQWNSKRCPVCQAPIIDVVRAYSLILEVKR